MSYKYYDPETTDIKDSTWKKYQAVADAYLQNGQDAAAAYQSVYPNCKQRKDAQNNFCKIKKIPQIAAYIAKCRTEAFENRSIDLMRVTEEIANLAFCKKGDEDVSATVKLKALELLQKALREDEKAQNNNSDNIVIGLEEEKEDENEDNS